MLKVWRTAQCSWEPFTITLGAQFSWLHLNKQHISTNMHELHEREIQSFRMMLWNYVLKNKTLAKQSLVNKETGKKMLTNLQRFLGDFKRNTVSKCVKWSSSNQFRTYQSILPLTCMSTLSLLILKLFLALPFLKIIFFVTSALEVTSFTW